MDDDAEALSDRIAAADGVVIGSPTYASNVSGHLKQFIDRGHFVMEQLLRGKYAVSVATGENYGSKDTSRILIKLLQYSGAYLIGGIRHNLPFNRVPDGKALEKQIHSCSAKLYRDIICHRKYPMQALVHRIVFSAGIKPFVKEKGKDYQGVAARWSHNGISVREEL